MSRSITVASFALFACSMSVFADDVGLADLGRYDLSPISMEPSIKLSLAEPPAAAPNADTGPKGVSTNARPIGYTIAGSRWWTVGTGYANNFDSAHDINIHGAFSQFLADDFEFAVEAAVWYFNQPSTDTGGLSGSMIFRWHFWKSDDRAWTVFGDAGIGLLGAFDNVPDGGSSFNFLPRVGLGFTRALNTSVEAADGLESRGPRFMAGVRWHHISNARINSDDRNPARDSVMIYAALVFPF